MRRFISALTAAVAIATTALAAFANPAAPAKSAGQPKYTAPSAASAPFWTGHPDAAAFAKMESQRLELAKSAIDRLIAVKGRRTIEDTLRLFDDATLQLDAASSQSSLLSNVHPD